MPTLQTARGFTLLEALIASALVATAVVACVHLVTMAASQTLSVRRTTAAHLLAQSKLEALRAAEWRYDIDGRRVSSDELNRSPPWSLRDDIDGWVDELDRFGAPVDRGQTPFYRRRWAIEQFTDVDPDTLVVRVCVFALGGLGNLAIADACVCGLRTRKP
jgi:type II secretory pathway pseudopilin PulG